MSSDRVGLFGLGFFVFAGLLVMGYLLADAAVSVKEYERTVTAKGLSEREVPADVVIWPIRFTVAGNDLTELYDAIDANTAEIFAFLESNGLSQSAMSTGAPAITDKLAQQYGNQGRAEFRYSAVQTVTVYSNDVERVRALSARLSDLGKRGIVFSGGNYGDQTEYLVTRLNDLKPEMIEEATRKAREVAEKFAEDSRSVLGKIRRARQGQFSVSPRDKNNPHIKKVRVVSTVEYYLSD